MTQVSSTYVPAFTPQRGLEVAGALLLLLGISAMSLAGIAPPVVYICNGLWAAAMLLVVRLRWRARFPLRAALHRIMVTATILIIALWAMTLLPSPMNAGIDPARTSPAWRFAAAVLAAPAALGREFFFRGLLYDLARQKGGVGAAVVVAGLSPVALQGPFSGSLQGMLLAAMSGCFSRPAVRRRVVWRRHWSRSVCTVSRAWPSFCWQRETGRGPLQHLIAKQFGVDLTDVT